jgi:hypothetical protein
MTVDPIEFLPVPIDKPAYDLRIDKITPAQIFEGDQFRVAYTFTNNTPQSVSGYICQIVNNQQAQGTPVQSFTMGPGMSHGAIVFTAGKASYDPFQLGFFKTPPPPSIEFPPPDSSDQASLPIGTYVVVGIDQVFILNTRSFHEDTDIATLGTTVGNRSFGPVSVPMGKVNNGPHDPNLRVGPMPIIPFGDDLVIAYAVLNKGYDASNEATAIKLCNAISDITAIALTAEFPAYGPIWTIGDAITHELNAIFGANCDGVVAGDKIQMSVKTILQDPQMRATGRYAETMARLYRYPPAALGCNPSGSDYTIRWYIQKVPKPT